MRNSESFISPESSNPVPCDKEKKKRKEKEKLVLE